MPRVYKNLLKVGCVYFILVLISLIQASPSLAALFVSGDLNRDGKVDIYDFVIFYRQHGRRGTPGEIVSDINQDGKVDIYDFNIFTSNYGQKKQGNFPPKKDRLNFCANVNLLNISEESYRDPKFLQQVKDLELSYIRIPGGTVSGYWDWSRGGLADRETIRRIINHPNPNFRYPLARYQKIYHTIPTVSAFLHAVDIPPIFVLNMTSSSLDKEIAYLKEFEKQGIPIRYVELGNELYLPRGARELWHPTAQQYTQMAADWIPLIQTEFPQAEIAFVGERINRGTQWNNEVKNIQLDNATIHPYIGSNIEPLDNKCGMVKTCVRDRFNVTTDVWDLYLGTALYSAKSVDPAVKRLGGNKKLWFTEYNIWEKNVATGGTWAHGLFVLNQSLAFLANSNVELACVHTLTQQLYWSLIWSDDYEYSAAGHILKYLGEAIKNATTMEPIVIPNADTKVVPIQGQDFSYQQQYGYQFTNQRDESKFLIVNLAAEPKAINIARYLKQGKFKQIYQDPGKAIMTADDVNEEVKPNSDGQIMLKPYSVTLLE